MDFTVEKIEAMIFLVRGQRVMLDSDLANLYGVETKRLKEQVKRNRNRFPDDFLIEPNSDELATLRSQIATLAYASNGHHKFTHSPFLFTENGVAMLSTVLNSERSIQINITIMRTFTKLRSFLAMESSQKGEITLLKEDTNNLFRIVFERLDEIENQIEPKLESNRKKIGLNS